MVQFVSKQQQKEGTAFRIAVFISSARRAPSFETMVEGAHIRYKKLFFFPTGKAMAKLPMTWRPAQGVR
jgi:hypothetical protein